MACLGYVVTQLSFTIHELNHVGVGYTLLSILLVRVVCVCCYTPTQVSPNEGNDFRSACYHQMEREQITNRKANNLLINTRCTIN